MMGQSAKNLWKLVTLFILPYKVRLTVGIIAGALAGGSLLAILQLSPALLSPFQPEPSPERPAAAQTAAPEGITEAAAHPDSLGKIKEVADFLDIPTQAPDGSISWQLMVVACSMLIVCFLLRAAATFVSRYQLRWVGARAVLDLRNRLFGCLQKQSLAYYGKIDVGKLISRCTNDTARIEATVSNTVAQVVRAPIEIAAAGSFIIVTARRHNLGGLIVLLLLSFPVCFVPLTILSKYVKRYARQSLERIAVLVSRMQENFTGIRVVKAYNMEKAEYARFAEMNEHYFNRVMKGRCAELLMTPSMELVSVACGCLFIIMCYVEAVTLHHIIPVALAGIMAYKPTKQLAKINVKFQHASAAADRIFEIINTDTSLPEKENPTVLEDFNDRIVFDHVSFRYDKEDSGFVIDDLCLEIPRGSVVAFVGKTGSGKTTVANLLARFYDPVEGRITIDGHDLTSLDVAALRRMIGIVTQETILFNDTIAHNISYGTPGADMDRIIEAAKSANAHQFIMAHEDQYQRVVGEKGFVLSGGQRQRVAVARAILKNPPILILDEATSALDTATEQLVQEAIDHVMEHRTVFAIAHRLSTIQHADMICLLDNGAIAERGTHTELFEKEGRYRELCDMQFT